MTMEHDLDDFHMMGDVFDVWNRMEYPDRPLKAFSSFNWCGTSWNNCTVMIMVDLQLLILYILFKSSPLWRYHFGYHYIYQQHKTRIESNRFSSHLLCQEGREAQRVALEETRLGIPLIYGSATWLWDQVDTWVSWVAEKQNQIKVSSYKHWWKKTTFRKLKAKQQNWISFFFQQQKLLKLQP